MAYPGDMDEGSDWPPPARNRARNATAIPANPQRRIRNEQPHSTKAAFLSMGTVFASLLAIGMATAALFAPTKTDRSARAIGADLASFASVGDSR